MHSILRVVTIAWALALSAPAGAAEDGPSAPAERRLILLLTPAGPDAGSDPIVKAISAQLSDLPVEFRAEPVPEIPDA